MQNLDELLRTRGFAVRSAPRLAVAIFVLLPALYFVRLLFWANYTLPLWVGLGAAFVSVALAVGLWLFLQTITQAANESTTPVVPTHAREKEVPPNELEIYHRRADHEDLLHIYRTTLLLTFNGFIAIAVPLVAERSLRVPFAVVIAIIDLFWLWWVKNPVNYIRMLREAGGARVDENLRQVRIVPREHRFRRAFAPLTMISYYIPAILLVGWIGIALYYGFLHAEPPNTPCPSLPPR